MAMAGARLVIVPVTTAPAIRRVETTANVETSRPNSGDRFGNGCSTSSGVVLSSCCRLPSLARSGSRNADCRLRASSHCFGLGGYGIGLRVQTQAPRKLVKKALRIDAQNFDPKNFDPKKIDANNVIATLVKVGKQGLEAGTKLVPDSVPRPVAQLGVGLAGLLLGSFVIRSLFSTVFFIVAVGGLGYLALLFLSKGEGGSSSGSSFDKSSGKPKSTDEALEEARRIMDKYK
ncbi:hypothetical protein R1flu_017072 [Riccia fluitans]|uniref:Uncharacterized protein n=1 Tax=Riccia fluitans TaxID=41844 RepID=A0ABD1YNM9_9MARC